MADDGSRLVRGVADRPMIVRIMTRPCVWCKRTAELEVDDTEIFAYAAGSSVQDAFPKLTADERELIITGTHAHCWAAIHTPEEDDV